MYSIWYFADRLKIQRRAGGMQMLELKFNRVRSPQLIEYHQLLWDVLDTIAVTKINMSGIHLVEINLNG